MFSRLIPPLQGLSIFEHSLVSLAAFTHNTQRRQLFLGIVSDGAVFDAFKKSYGELNTEQQVPDFPPFFLGLAPCRVRLLSDRKLPRYRAG